MQSVLSANSARTETRNAALVVATVFAAIEVAVGFVVPDSAQRARIGILAVAIAMTVAVRALAAHARWFVSAGLLVGIAIIVFETSRSAPTLPGASAVVYLGVVPFFVLLVDGLGASVAIGVLCVGCIAWVGRHVAFEGRYVSTGISNIALTALIGTACAAIHETNARRFRRIAHEYTDERRSELELAQTLSGLLFSEFRAPLVRIRAVLRSAAVPDLALIAQETAVLGEVLARGRAKVLARKPAATLAPFDPREEALRAPVVVPVLITLAIGIGIALARNIRSATAPLAPLVVVLIAGLVLMTRHGQLRHARLALAALSVLIGGAHIAAHFAWGLAADSPALVSQPALAMIVYSIAGPIAGTAAALLACVDIAITAHHGGMPLQGGVEVATTVLTATWFALSCCWLYWRALRLEIGSADQCARAYGDATRHRYRLMTTFFHDQGNLLMPLGIIAGSDNVPDSDATLREIVDRMIALLDAVESIEGSDAVIDGGATATISVGRILDDLRLLFAARAESKGLHLVLEGDRELHVRALPAVLVDSVLSNLVSNAIKFTAPGGTVRVRASLVPEERVALTVHDDGPGIPSAVLARLDRAERLPSTKGTAGEEGHGFGLLLARDFAQRMGGRFRIGRAGRGGEVVVDLPRHAIGVASRA